MHNKFNITADFSLYTKVFLEENAKLNLISKNDEKFLYAKHIYDSLAIKLFDKLADGISMLDIGCGGGFPCIPIAIEFPDIQILGVDSIRKKVNAVNNIIQALNLQNITAICDRVENINDRKFDIITSRAVADLAKIINYALPLLKKEGYFIAYKSKKALEEIKNAQPVLEKYNAKIIDIIEYTLPLPEVYERNLIIIGF